MGHFGPFGTTTVKIPLLYEAVCQLSDNDIVCAVDAFDVFFCANQDEILQKFLSMECDCVVSAERIYAHQFKKYKRFYDKTPSHCPYRYVNSGGVIGYAHALKKLYSPNFMNSFLPRIFTIKSIRRIKEVAQKFKKLVNLKSFDVESIYSFIYYADGQHVGKYIAKNPHGLKIRLDHDSLIFWCCAHEWTDIDLHFKINDARIINVHTNKAPAIIHVPGWRKHGHVLEQLYNI